MTTEARTPGTSIYRVESVEVDVQYSGTRYDIWRDDMLVATSEDRGHAEAIVLAANSHDALVAACEQAMAAIRQGSYYGEYGLLPDAQDKLRAAIAQAKETP